MNKLEQFLFYFFLVVLPFSTRYIFGYEAASFMEWKAVSVYGTDVLVGLLLCFWAWRGTKFKLQVGDWLLVALVAVAALSSLWALNEKVAFYRALKLAECVALFWYIKHYAWKLFEREKMCLALVLGGFFQAGVAIIQFSLQHSLGFNYFGESVLAPGMTGVAAFMSAGVKVIRGYGTTPHPNITATYLLLAMAAYWMVYPLFKKQWWWHAVYMVLVWGLLVTFSRSVIAVGVMLFGAWAVWEFKKYKALIILSCIVGAVFLAGYWPYVVDRLTIASEDEAVALRVLYNHEALSRGLSWIGVGNGNFVPWLMRQSLPVSGIGLSPDQYQPVHNIYLLIYTELGLAGIGLFIAWLASIATSFFKKITRERVVYAGLFIVLLSIGLFDHFLWTIQAGCLLFWLTAGLISAEPHV